MDAKISHEAIHFNSHPHEEDDFIRTVRDIYARYFNSHPHEEDDYILPSSKHELMIFQLTSSRGG